MKKFKVECLRDNGCQYYGEEPHSTIFFQPYDGIMEAEDEEEAIELTKQYIIENVESVEIGKDELLISNCGKVVECFYNFVVKEV